jgi:hypothetical protein
MITASLFLTIVRFDKPQGWLSLFWTLHKGNYYGKFFGPIAEKVQNDSKKHVIHR